MGMMSTKKHLLALGLLGITPLFVACNNALPNELTDQGDCMGHGICIPEAGPGPISRTAAFLDAIDEAHPEIADSEVTLTLNTATGRAVASDWVVNGLTPGDVVTVWWVFFTNQADCTAGVAGSLCGASDLQTESTGPGFGYAGPAPMGGAIADANGEASFGPLTTDVVDEAAENPDFLIGNGLRDINTTEVHLVLRTHGKALGGTLEDSQLGTFNGGCLEGEPNVGQCANIQFAYFNPLGN